MPSILTQAYFGQHPAAPISSTANLPSPTRPWIERQFALFHTIIPAQSEDITHRRTSYFYRKEAIGWASMARQRWPSSGFRALCARLAKSYFSTYREMKGLR